MTSAGADFLQLSPAAAPARGLTSWLARAIRAAIMDGRLRAGTSLPATRQLADDLGVSRGVIVEAYQRLADEGLVSARPGAGTKVSALPRPPAPSPPAPSPPAPSLAVPSPAAPSPPAPSPAAPRRPLRPAPSVLPQRWRMHAELDLSPGVPDLSGFPRAAWLRAERSILDRASVADLGYGDPRGSQWLRDELAGWLARTRGLRATAEDVIIVSGVAQALALLAQWLYAAGRTPVAVEDPGSRGAHDELAYWGLHPVPVPVDDQGLRTGDLTDRGLRAVLLIRRLTSSPPAWCWPRGGAANCSDWAAAADAVIIEDDYDAEYRYDRAPVPALQASAPGHVAYAGSTSKTLAPGMRLGWLVPPVRLREDLVEAKHAADLGSPALPQLVLAHLIATGELEHHIRQVRKRQRTRRDALLGALREHLPGARVQGVAAGLHLLITFPELTGQIEDTDLAERIHRAGVLGPSSTRCPGTVSGPGPPGWSWAMRRTRPISCATRSRIARLLAT